MIVFSRRARVAASAVLVSLALAGGASARGDAPIGVIAAIERAPGVVVAEVRQVTPLAHAGYRATLEVERSLRPGVDAPETLQVAWEESAPSLPPRLDVGRRVLVAAEALPTASIWRLRVPDDAARTAMLGLAGDGAGYLERPGAAELDVLEHYLQVDAEAREGDAGALHLARLSAVGQPRLARDAAKRLTRFDSLSDHVTPGAARALVDALLRTDDPKVRETLLEVIEIHRPEALRSPLRARIDSQGPATPPVLYAALGTLDGELDEDVALALLASGSEEARIAAARHATGPRARGRLRDLLRGDPSPAVRAAAVDRLVALDGMAALSDATLAFEDTSPHVRKAAVEAAARLDPEAVDRLRDLADRGAPEPARLALVALSMMGEEAHLALAALAAEHPDATIRTLAGIAVGQPIGDAH